MDKKKSYVPPRLTEYDPKNIQSDTLNPSTARLLIFDDNRNIRYILRAYVESHTPYKICGEAAQWMESIEKAKELQPDLISYDLYMQIMTGVDAARIVMRA